MAEPLFNNVAFDTRGLQYINAVSVPGDGEDVVHFRIVPGQTEPTIRVSLECDATDPARVSADLVDADFTVLETIQCGDEDINVVLQNATSLDEFQFLVRASGDDPVYGDFTLSINGFCSQQCDYMPFES